MAQGMGGLGNCWDNSPTEWLSRSFKHEQLNYEKISTKASAKSGIIDVWLFRMVKSHIQIRLSIPAAI
jgi:hypothetical protein